MAADFVVEGGHGKGTGLEALEERFREKVVFVGRVGTHFEVHAVEDGKLGAVDATPIGHGEAFEAPFLLEDFVEQQIVLATVLAAEEVVGAHDAEDVGFADGGAEGGKIDFAKGAVVHVDVDTVAFGFLIVGGEMFDTGADALGLLAADVIDGDARGEEGIFAKVFKVAATERRALNVDARAEHDVFVTLLGFLPDDGAVLVGEVGIEGGGEANGGGHGGGEIVAVLEVFEVLSDLFADAERAVVHPKFGNAEARHAGNGESGLRMNHGDFFFQRDAREEIVDALADGFGVVEVCGTVIGAGRMARSAQAAAKRIARRRIAAGHGVSAKKCVDIWVWDGLKGRLSDRNVTCENRSGRVRAQVFGYVGTGKSWCASGTNCFARAS